MADTGNKRKETIKLREGKGFTWKIDNFRAMIDRLNNTELKDAGYVFEAGDNIGLPTSWKLYLQKFDRVIKINMELFSFCPNFPKEIKKVTASFGYTYTSSGRFDDSYEPREYSENQGFSDILLWSGHFSEDNLENRSLVIKVTFSLYNVLVDEKYKREKFELLSRYEAAEDFQKLLDSGEDADVTFQMKDGQVLKAHSVILKTRSRVFSAMLRNQMQKSSSGIIRIEDVSYEAMKIILAFIYTGNVDDKWVEVIEETVYAANKYELLLLVKFCDENLVTTCTVKNACWNRLDFAKLHRLKTAQVDIGIFIKTHIDEIIQAKISS